MQSMKRVVLVSILMLCLFIPMEAQAQIPGLGVDIECSQQTIKINVHPQQNAPVEVDCTVKNTGQVAEEISLDSNVEGNGFSLVLSETTFDLGAGEDASFVATFSASAQLGVITEDYNISARVVSFGVEPIFIPLGGVLEQTAELSGEVSSLPYSKIDFKLASGYSTMTIEEKGEDGFLLIQLELSNEGNADDTIFVSITNQQELDDLGLAYAFYSESPLYVGVDFYRETIGADRSSDAGFMTIGIAELPDEDISIDIKLRAYSDMSGSDEDYIEISVPVTIKGSGSSGGVLGLDSVSSDNMKLIGMATGGFIGLILLLVVISRLTKKTGKRKIAAKEAKRVAKKGRKSNKSAKRAKKANPVVEEDEDLDSDDDFEDDFGDLDDDFDFDDL